MKNSVYLFRNVLFLFAFLFAMTIRAGDSPGNLNNDLFSIFQAPPVNITKGNSPTMPLAISAGLAYGNNVWTNQIVEIDPADPASATAITPVSFVSAGGDFHPDQPDKMWVINMDDNTLKRVGIFNGIVDHDVLVPLPVDGGIWTDLAIRKSDGAFYGIAATGEKSVVAQIDPNTGTVTPVLTLEDVSAAISGAFDAAGMLYLFDVALDQIWGVDVDNSTATQLGFAGFDGNFAQGMGHDPATDNIYLAAYNNVDGPELRLLDKATGNTSLIGGLPGEITAFGFPGEGASGSPFIAPGQDQYQIPQANLTFGEDLPPIPSDFFNPGSEPFFGTIEFKGGMSNGGQLPEADLIVQRLDGIELPPPYPASGTIPIEIVGLHLKSIEPILVSSNGVDSFFDITVALLEDFPQPGSILAEKEDENGGTFMMDFNLTPIFIFTNVDNPADEIVFIPSEFGNGGLPLLPLDPLAWMVPPIPQGFDPFWQGSRSLATPSGNTVALVPLLIRNDFLFVSMDDDGTPEMWEGTGYNNSEWYYYPFTDWWNVWFYDHPLDEDRHKLVSGTFDVIPRDPTMPSYVEIIINWSTPEWPSWNGYPEVPYPPLPEFMTDPDFENQVIERSEPIFVYEDFITEPISFPLPSEYLNSFTGLYNYNPEWISVDIRGFNYILEGTIEHVCFRPFDDPCIPPPEVVCPPDMEMCLTDGNVTLSGATPSGGSYSGPGVGGSDSFSPSLAGVGTHTITYTLPEPCPAECTFEITVHPPPEVICPDDFTLCADDDPIDLMTLVSPQGGTFPGGGQIFDPSTVPPGVPLQVRYEYTDPVTGCKGSCIFYITTYPNPEPVCPSDTVVCEDVGVIDLSSLGASPAGGKFVDMLGNEVSEFDATGAGDASYVFTYCVTDPQTGCEGCCDFAITVYANPEVECPENFSVCIGDGDVSLTGAPAGGTFNGPGMSGQTFSPSDAGMGNHTIEYCYTDPQTGCESCCEFTATVEGVELDCPDDLAACIDDNPFVPAVSPAGGSYNGNGIVGGQFDPLAAGIGVHTIEYCYTDPQTGCEDCCEFTITVYPSPNVTCPPDDEVCIDEAPFALGGGNPAGGSYSGAGVAGNTFNPANAGVGAHTIEYCYTDPQTGCEGCCQFTITVHPLPQVTCPPDIQVCEGDPAITLGGATPAGGAYSDAAGNVINTFNPAAAGTYVIFYDYTDPVTNCSNWCSFTITVHPLPIVTCPANIVVCENDPAFALAGATPAGGVYSDIWGNVFVNFNPAAWGVGVHNIFYDYTDQNGCSNWCSFTITVIQAPVVTCPNYAPVCIDDNPFALAGANPPGGTYVGPGVAAGVFNPAAAGVGVHNINYCYIDPTTGCAGCCTFTITVNPLPNVTCPMNLTVCITDAAFPLFGGAPGGGTYAGPGVALNVFNPGVAGIGVHNINYTYTDPVTNCSNTCNFNITVNPVPVVTCPPNQTVCNNDPGFALAGGAPAGGVYTIAGAPVVNFNPAAAPLGANVVTYTYTDPATGCSNSCAFTITVVAAPNVTCPPNMNVCVDDPQFQLAGGAPAGGIYSIAGVAVVDFDPATNGAGNYTVDYDYTDPVTGCSNSCSFTITVNALPAVMCPPDFTVSVFDAPFMLAGAMPVGGTYTDAANNVIANFDPAGFGTGNHIINYTYTDNNGCTNSCDFMITVVDQTPPMDYGDAPDDSLAGYYYPTLLASDGARHIISSAVFLGDLIDAEPDGQPSILADGDDTTNLDDEDGVMFRGLMAVGSLAKVSIKASVDGYINAWVDFGSNGTWADSLDQIFVDQPVVAGWNTLTFTVPGNAVPGRTYARFRYNTTGGLSYDGLALNGEVEDYLVTIYPPGWSVVTTDVTHLIIVPQVVNPALTSTGLDALKPGDFLGVFFQDEGTQKCGGAILREDSGNQILVAFGDDPLTTEKEGFDDGEDFNFKIFDAALGQAFDYDAGFDLTMPNSDGKFHNNGLSALTSLTPQGDFQTIAMPEGWSGISTHILPSNPDLATMFAPVMDKLVVLYNQQGAFWPGQNLFMISEWDTYSGYAVKMESDAVLTISGSQIFDQSIALNAGWSIMPVLSDGPFDIELLMSSLSGFVAVKDVAGLGVYLPTYNINTIGSVLPGKSYHIFTSEPGTIYYMISELKSQATEQPAAIEISSPWNAVSQSPSSHLVVFNVDANVFENGDIIGAFTPDGTCAGVINADISGKPFALVANASDPYTNQFTGFKSGQELTFRLYRENTGEYFDLEVAYTDGFSKGYFEPNGLSEVTMLKLSGTGLSGHQQDQILLWPNPSTGMINVDGVEHGSAIQIIDAFGKVVLTLTDWHGSKIDLSAQPKGVYFLKAISTDGFESTHKLIVQ